MAVTARFTEQIVILTTPERAAWIKERAEHYGVSQAQIARDCIEMGAEALVVEYKRRGLGLGGVGLPVRKARVSQTAPFQAPVSA